MDGFDECTILGGMCISLFLGHDLCIGVVVVVHNFHLLGKFLLIL